VLHTAIVAEQDLIDPRLEIAMLSGLCACCTGEGELGFGAAF
jgi:hypothetical protein